MDMNKITPLWFVQGDVLRLSVHYWKRNETSSGHGGCSANWCRTMEDGDFTTAYNSIVDAAKEEFHSLKLKKIKVPKDPNAVKESANHDVTIVMTVFALAIGAFIGSVFF